jgi:hypothetical protein
MYVNKKSPEINLIKVKLRKQGSKVKRMNSMADVASATLALL